MPRSNILVVVVDGLRASALGPYGNTTFPTPALDQFAADSLLLDRCYATAADLTAIYRALWQSMHPARLARRGDLADGMNNAPILPALLRERGYRTTLVTDEPQLTSLFALQAFDECRQFESFAEISTSPARVQEISETKIARVFAAASDVAATRPEAGTLSTGGEAQPKFVWVHVRGLYGEWDAPVEMRQSLLDEDDPPPIEAVSPPDFLLAANDNPDTIFRHSSAYAAQVIAFDACWQGLLDVIDSTNTPWLVMLIGARGFPLGEHQRIGGVDSRLYAEQLHVPWLMRFPDGRGRLARSSALTTHLDVMPTLLDWIDGDSQGASRSVDGLSTVPLAESSSALWRDALLFVAEGSSCCLRSATWCLRENLPPHAETNANTTKEIAAELFVRPDDLWEANDVSKLCPDVVEELRAAMISVLHRLSNGEPMPRNVLPAEAGAGAS